MSKTHSSTQTFSNRFDIVYRAFIQAGEKRFLFDRDYYHLSWYFEDVSKYRSLGVLTDRLSSVFKEQNQRSNEIYSAPLIKNGRVKLFNNGQITIDGQIYDFLQRSPHYDRNCFHFSKEAIDLINNAKIDQETSLYIDEIINHGGNATLGMDGSSIDPEYPDRMLYGIYDAEDYYFAKNLKAILSFRVDNNKTHGILTELAGGSEFNPRSKSSFGMYDFMPGDTDENKYKSAVSFIAKFYVLYNATKTPISIMKESEAKMNTKTNSKNKSITDVHVQHYYVSLSKEYKERRKQAEEKHPLNKDNMELIPTQVSGYIRTQHFGKGNRETKRIWVDGFVRNQWNTKNAKSYLVN